jgi:mono/diheme cytochrome c family protein
MERSEIKKNAKIIRKSIKKTIGLQRKTNGKILSTKNHIMNNSNEFKTEAEKKQAELTRKIVLEHCVQCHQQLDLLQLRLITFDDLISGVLQTITNTERALAQSEVKPEKKESELKKV